MAQKRTYYMWSGNVRNLPFPERMKATSSAGFDILTFSPYDWLDAMRGGLSTPDMKTMAADAGIGLDHMDPIARWAPEFMPDNITEPAYLTFLLCDVDDFLRIGEALEITSMTAICSFPAGMEVPLNQLVDGFGKLCERAAPLGMRVDLEFVPMWGLRDLKTAWAIVQRADRPNSGLIFDFYHFMRHDPDEALLEAIPSERTLSVQVSDARIKINPNLSLFQDCIFRRELPGQGEFPVTRFLQTLERKGAMSRLGPETFSSKLDRVPGDQLADLIKRTFKDALDQPGLAHDFPRR